jgi:hypothetical protein
MSESTMMNGWIPRTVGVAAALLVLSVMIGCVSGAVYAAEGDEPVRVTLDKARGKAGVELGERRYRLGFVQITDSRCPKDAQCIWAGELSARIRIERLDEPAGPREITLGQQTAPSMEIMGARLDLVSINEASVTLTMQPAEKD